jgi:hypothetical protein
LVRAAVTGKKLGIEALRELIFGDYPFDSNPAATGRSFLFLVRGYVRRIFSTREKISRQ